MANTHTTTASPIPIRYSIHSAPSAFCVQRASTLDLRQPNSTPHLSAPISVISVISGKFFLIVPAWHCDFTETPAHAAGLDVLHTHADLCQPNSTPHLSVQISVISVI